MIGLHKMGRAYCYWHEVAKNPISWIIFEVLYRLIYP